VILWRPDGILIAFPLLVPLSPQQSRSIISMTVVNCASLLLLLFRRWNGIGPNSASWPSQAYGFTSQQFLFGVYGNLRAPSVQRMTSVVKQVPVHGRSASAIRLSAS